MKTAARWAALFAGLGACLGVAYGAYTLATYSWNQVVDYRGPYAKASLPEAVGAARGTVTGRVVYVIVDGLRDDVSRQMPKLNVLRASGYDAVVRTSQPSLSFPNWTTLLSGAPQRISGVTTNWFEGRVPVETLVDVALAESRTVVVSAPEDFETLYGVKRSPYVFLRTWDEKSYMSTGIVDEAIRLTGESSATLVIVHLPDIDEAGHAFGGASKEYLDTAKRVDTDLGRLVGALQNDRTTFVVASDHGHVAAGGHGGWEDVAVLVPAVLSGPGVKVGVGEGTQDQIAPTVAELAGLAAPRNATGEPLDVATSSKVTPIRDRIDEERLIAYDEYAAATSGDAVKRSGSAKAARSAFDTATAARLARERAERLPLAAGLALAAVLAIVAVGAMSWRALVSALSGALAYYLVYNGLYFGLHRYGLWSLSSFNSESMLKGFMNARMIEAVIAGVVAVFVAADIYLATRREPKRPAGEYLPGWLSLGVATVLVIQATLAVQVAWYLWYWGASLTWYIPDLEWGFKYDLDLIQLTALGAAALLAPVLTYLVGRYHPLRKAKPVAENA